MTMDRSLPTDALEFIRRCVRERKVHWTYHVNMRLAGRYISRDELFEAVDSYEIIESYPQDKYLPSYPVRAESDRRKIHVLFAVDVENDNVRIVTAYRPNPDEWDAEFRSRREQR
jgi:hypothetical protein